MDNAVSFFGNYIEGKLSETNKNGKPIYKLEDLLKDTSKMSAVQQLEHIGSQVSGFVDVIQVKD